MSLKYFRSKYYFNRLVRAVIVFVVLIYTSDFIFVYCEIEKEEILFGEKKDRKNRYHIFLRLHGVA